MVSRSRLFAAVLSLLLISRHAAALQEGDRLKAELEKHYRLATSRIGRNGDLVYEPGTILTVRRDGIISFDDKSDAFVDLCPSEVRGGNIRPPRGLACTGLAIRNRRPLRIAQAVCVTGIQTAEPSDEISLLIVTCGAYGPRRRMVENRARVVFHLSKGMLAEADPRKVEEVIERTLSVRPIDIVTIPEKSPPAVPTPDAHPPSPAETPGDEPW